MVKEQNDIVKLPEKKIEDEKIGNKNNQNEDQKDKPVEGHITHDVKSKMITQPNIDFTNNFVETLSSTFVAEITKRSMIME